MDYKEQMITIALESNYQDFAYFIEQDNYETLEYAINFDGTDEARDRLITLIEILFCTGGNGVIREYHFHEKLQKKPSTNAISKTIDMIKNIGFGEVKENNFREQIFMGRLGPFTLTDLVTALEKVKGQIDDVNGNAEILKGMTPVQKHFNMRQSRIKNEISLILRSMGTSEEYINYFIEELFKYYGIE